MCWLCLVSIGRSVGFCVCFVSFVYWCMGRFLFLGVYGCVCMGFWVDCLLFLWVFFFVLVCFGFSKEFCGERVKWGLVYSGVWCIGR